MRRRYWLVAAGFAVVVMNAVVLNLFVPTEFAEDQVPWMLTLPPMFAVGSVLVIRVPGNAVGWLLFGIGVVGSFGTLQGFGALDGWLAATGAAASTSAITLLSLLVLIFPNGSLPSHRWRPVRAFMVTTAALGGTVALLVGFWGGAVDQARFLSPLYESTRRITPVASDAFFALYSLSFGAALASLVVRYRSGTSEVRHQLKWLLAAVAFTLATVAGLVLLRSGVRLVGGWDAVPLAAGLASIPIAIGIAVLRYRLYDIDLVISKAVTYGVLAAFIGAVYVGIVVGVGELLGQGEGAGFGLSIVATAVVAMAFQPVRRWVERRANRLVYGERATPYEVLAGFSRGSAEEADEEALARIPRLIVDGTGAASAALWVRTGDGFRAAYSWPDGPARRLAGREFTDPAADHSLPVSHDGELLGGISLTKAKGDAISPVEEGILAGLAGGLGLALRNARLTARLRRQVEDLERSRDRVVTAADEARRSLEHQLDSGPQQQLVALKVKLGPLRRMAERAGATRTAEVLGQLDDAAGQAIRAVRDFAGGVYPPLLEAEGLAVAIRQQARKAALPVSVDATGVGRYPREVEAAVYFTVLEALQNATKYAGDAAVAVKLRDAGGSLFFEVRDDGTGFDPETAPAGAGVTNMNDRLDAVGGRCTVESAPGAGTSVRGAVPVPALV